MADAFDLLKMAAIFFAFAGGYVAVRSGLMRLAAPVYRAVGRNYERLLDDKQLPADDREAVEFVGRHMFNGWMLWLLVLMTPFSVIYGLISSSEESDDLGDTEGEFYVWAAIGLMAQNPIAAVILVAELIVFVAPAELIRRGSATAMIGRSIAHRPKLAFR
jgi:hypothetical protein